MGSGKGGNTLPPPDVQSPDMGGMMMAMQNMMAASAQQQQLPEAPDMTPLPEVEEVTPTDWTEKQDALKAKTLADYNTTQATKKGRLDTVHTSPLLDDQEDTTVASSILTGE